MKKRLVMVLLVCCLLAGIGTALAEPVKIGLLGPMTGPLVDEGRQMQQVVALLATDLNARGGLLGRPVKIVVADDQGIPQQGIEAAKKLVDEGVVAVIGSVPSSVTAAVQDIFGKARVIQITNASTAVSLSQKGIRTFFRTCPRDDDQAEAAVEVMADLGCKKVAILHDNTLYSRGLADTSQALLGDKKIGISCEQTLAPGQTDYRDILARLQATNPDLVFFTGYYPEAGVLLRQKMEMDWSVPFLGGDASNNEDLVEIEGAKTMAGFRFVTLPRPENLPSPEARQFLQKFAGKYGREVSSTYALLGGDAFLLIAFAIEKTNSTDPDRLADCLHNQLESYQGLTGSISFDQNGDREGQVFVDYQLDDKGKPALQM